jgi:DNA (cytosine-5)-methyltransferase 1
MLTIRGLGTVLGDLAEMGFDAIWGVLGAHEAGGGQLRKRLWIVACTNSHGLQRKSDSRVIKCCWKEREEQLERLLESERRMALPAGRNLRISDAVAHRVDRLKAIGNGQVPAVVRLAWEILSG